MSQVLRLVLTEVLRIVHQERRLNAHEIVPLIVLSPFRTWTGLREAALFQSSLAHLVGLNLPWLDSMLFRNVSLQVVGDAHLTLVLLHLMGLDRIVLDQLLAILQERSLTASCHTLPVQIGDTSMVYHDCSRLAFGLNISSWSLLFLRDLWRDELARVKALSILLLLE